MNAPSLLEMVWRDVCFAHWRADATVLERTLPAGVTLDRYNGEAWLSVVPFRMTAVHARYAPVIPGFADVSEINLRTYVRVGDEPAIWFYSLDADAPIAVASARMMTSLPYFHARITTSENSHGITYQSERTDRRSVAGQFTARYTAPRVERAIQPGSLEAFLHERYRFVTQRGARLVSGEVRHRPWTIGGIDIDITQNTLGAIIGHRLSGNPYVAYFAREQHVSATAVRAVRLQGA